MAALTHASEPPVSPEVRRAIAAWVRASLGLIFPATRERALEHGIARVMSSVGERDPATLLGRLVRGDPAVRDALVIELTVGETYLFRDDHHFTYVRDVALPEAASRGGVVRLWSAGCATGEEAWSLAIVAHEALGEAAAARVEVIGTDLNPAFLERARVGWYGRWSFRGVDPARRARWFRPERDGWAVGSELRSTVRFRRLNFLDVDAAEWPVGVDVVLCRNVAIYFDQDTVVRVAGRLARSLREGGWFVPGPSDPLLPGGLGLVALPGGPLVYQRRSADAPVVAVPARETPVFAAPVVTARRHASATPPPPPRVASSQPRRVEPPDAVAAARSLADRGDLAGATRLLNEALVLDGLNPALYLLRSSVRQASGDHGGACDDADRAVLIDRSLAFAHVLAASARARLGDAPAARRALRNARGLLERVRDDAVVPYSDGQGRGALLALCDRLARALDPAPGPRTPGG